MPQTARSRTERARPLRPAVIPLVIATGLIIGFLLYQATTSSAGAHEGTPVTAARAPSPARPPRVDRVRTSTPRADRVTEEDGLLPDGVTVLDDAYPGVTNLDADLRRALREATADAAQDAIEIDLTSGWRSAAYQDELLREAIVRYGSRHEAARWVATSDTSPHVAGDAVDVGSPAASTWLSRNGARYGLCPVYRNEPWHFELRPQAPDDGCPRLYADPTVDPRMRG